MVNPQYAVKCLHLGFDRYKRYCKLPVTVKPSSTTISFYVEKPSSPKWKNAAFSDCIVVFGVKPYIVAFIFDLVIPFQTPSCLRSR